MVCSCGVRRNVCRHRIAEPRQLLRGRKPAQAAVQFARAINTAEAASFRGQRSYLQLGDLPIGAAPAETAVQLSTDGETYTFSIKDNQDACHGAVFSDQTGVIY